MICNSRFLNLLDGDVATLLPANESGLEDDAKGPIADDFAICVGSVFLVTGLAIGGDHFDDLVWVIDGGDLHAVYWTVLL